MNNKYLTNVDLIGLSVTVDYITIKKATCVCVCVGGGGDYGRELLLRGWG